MTSLSACNTEVFNQKLLAQLSNDLDKHQYSSDRQVAAALALQGSLLKKYNFTDDTTPEQDGFALEKFFSAQRHCAKFVPVTTRDRVLIQVRERLASIWKRCPSVSHSYAEHWDFGPGSSVGCATKDVATKFDVLTSTSAFLHRLFLLNQHSSRITDPIRALAIVRGSKLGFVPKTQNISRVICTEPVANMALQKVLEHLLTDALRREFGIDLTKQQQRNKRYARYGSIHGAFATIDLESASDTISLGLCKDVLPAQLYAWLCRARSRFTTLPDGRLVRLNMVSSMGNAFTFPLQTLIFACICEAVMDNAGVPRKRRFLPFCVNGDDIIVPNHLYGSITSELRRAGFLVNLTKSFHTGPFRESCGGDYHQGYDVRGVYLKRLRSRMDVYSAINRLRIWSHRHGIALFRTLRMLRELVRRVHYVPVGDDLSSGLWCTRSQALRYSRAKVLDQSLVLYNYAKVRVAHEPSKRVSAYWMCTRMVVSDGVLCELAKRPETKQITAVRATSVWPSWPEVVRFEIRRLRSKRLLAALTSQVA